MKKKFYYAIAQSDDIDSSDAANDVVDRCIFQLQGRKASAGLIYMGITIDHQAVLDIIHERLGDIELIGCTTDGEFSSETGYIQDSILLMLFCSDEIDFISGSIDISNSNPESIKTEICTSLGETGKKPRLGILLTDGFTLNGEDSLEIISSVFNDEVPFFGGVAADKWRKTGTNQFLGNDVLDDMAVYLLFCGNFDYSFATGTGWTPVGDYGIITNSEKNVVKEINNQPAIEFYRYLLGKSAVPAIDVPMAVYDENDSLMFLRTTVLDDIGKDGSVTFFASMPRGYKVRLTVVDRNAIIDGVKAAATGALNKFPRGKQPSIAVCFSCTARRALLGLRTEEECTAAQSILGESVIVFGFYTYGEFSPRLDTMKTRFHNETFVCLLLE